MLKIQCLQEFFASHGLTVVPMERSHHTKTLDTWIDICAVSDLSVLAAWGQSSQPFLSGHDLLYMTINYEVLSGKKKDVTYRSLKNVSSDVVEDFVLAYDTSVFDNELIIDSKLDAFNRMISDLLDY
ncbi:GSCOCG00012459001-RA-CDS, partial [Cotesia congregata]